MKDNLKDIAFAGFAPLDFHAAEKTAGERGASGPTLDALFDAYFDCRKHKRNTINQLRFETGLEGNLMALYRDLHEGRYAIGRSVAFVIERPKIREVWAANFRDRVVHHLIYNVIAPPTYRRFIRDSYACIPGRGAHDGLRRVSAQARSITRNWSRTAYVLKIDVANFFNSIDRRILLAILERDTYAPWLATLIRQVVLHDPRETVIRRSSRIQFDKVPAHKSLLRAADWIGLPIGNLTSQFFANVYMNEVDQFAKHVLKARYYGRYVDDLILMHDDPAVLNEWCARIDGFLRERLALSLHPNKISLNKIEAGFDFVGFIVKPGRTYIRRSTVNNCKQVIRAWKRRGAPIDPRSLQKLSESVTSYLGMLRQADAYGERKAICAKVEGLFLRADADCTKMKPQ